VAVPVGAGGVVRLGFVGGAELALDARDPWAVALCAMAAELLAPLRV
jgi:hypothetical protein